MFTLPFTTVPDDLLKIYVANQDVTDFVIDEGISFRSSTDYPYFSDSEVGDAVFTLENTSGDFDPLKPNNFFQRHGTRTGTLGDKWDRIGYRLPVVITSEGEILFAGHIIDINVDVETSSISITSNDISNEYREKELDTSEFGVERFLTVDEGIEYGEYILPVSASPINKDSVKLYTTDFDTPEPQTDTSISEGEFDRDAYTVHADQPAIVAQDAYANPPSVRFFEPYRWRRMDRLVNDLIDLIDEDLERDIDVPIFNSTQREFVSNGRVGWHIEGGESIRTARRWGYRGFVRDFVVNPSNGDAFFLYGGGFVGGEVQRHSVIHYIHSEDRYAKYQMEAYNARRLNGVIDNTDTSFSTQNNGAKFQRQSLWRIASEDFETFYIMASTGYNDTDVQNFRNGLVDPDTLDLNEHPVKLYEYGSHVDGSSQAEDRNKPKIFRWYLPTNKWTLIDWNDDYGGAMQSGINGIGYSPQLAQFIGLTKKVANQPLTDKSRNPENIRADTRIPFIAKSNRLIYKSHSNGNVRIIQYDTENHIGHVTHEVSETTCNGGWGYDFGVDDQHIYIIKCNNTSANSTLALLRISIGSSSSTPLVNILDNNDDSKWWNVSDITISHLNGVTYVYGILQHVDQEYTQGSLVVFRSNNDWDMEVVKTYNYYVHAARGGVVLDNQAYYFEGSVYPHVANYQPVNVRHYSTNDSSRQVWDSSTDYTRDDEVFYNSRYYRALRATTGDNPKTSIHDWEEFINRDRIPKTGRLINPGATSVDLGLVWRSAELPRDWYDEPTALQDYAAKLYGAHNAMIPPLRSDGKNIHMIAGYGDVQASMNLVPEVDVGDDLIDYPSDNINNWQWIQWGREYPLRIDKVEVAERERVWDFLKIMAELSRANININSQRFTFKQQSGIYSKSSSAITQTAQSLPLVDATAFPIARGMVLIGNEIIDFESKSGNTLALAGSNRNVYPTEASAHSSGEYVYLIDHIIDNYSVNQTIISISLDGKYEEIYNQIKGNVRYTVEHGIAPETQEYIVPKQDLVDLIGEIPFEINTELLSHHQLWWRDILADHYLTEFSDLSYDIDLTLTWSPKLRAGDTIAIDIKHPAKDGSSWTYRSGTIEWIPARIVELIHNAGGYTTNVVARTLPFE